MYHTKHLVVLCYGQGCLPHVNIDCASISNTKVCDEKIKSYITKYTGSDCFTVIIIRGAETRRNRTGALCTFHATMHITFRWLYVTYDIVYSNSHV